MAKKKGKMRCPVRETEIHGKAGMDSVELKAKPLLDSLTGNP